MPDARFYLSWYQMFYFVFVDLHLNLLHHETLLCDGHKKKVRRGYSENNTWKDLEQVKSSKDVAAKFNLRESSLHGRKMKKNLWHI